MLPRGGPARQKSGGHRFRPYSAYWSSHDGSDFVPQKLTVARSNVMPFAVPLGNLLAICDA